MKKVYMFLLVAFMAVQLNAQVDVTFQVDMTDYLKVAGNKIAAVGIAGNFAALAAKSGSTSLVDWTPASTPKFTNVGNVYSAKITFPNSAKGTDLLFKFMNGAAWGACGVDQECFDATTLPTPACTQGSGDFNRLLKIPTAATTICFKWGTCTTCGKVGVDDLLLENNVTITPNPTSLDAVVSIEGNGVYTINVTNAVGQVVRTIQNVTNQAVIEREGLASGLHFVVIRNNEGKFQTKKLVIE